MKPSLNKPLLTATLLAGAVLFALAFTGGAETAQAKARGLCIKAPRANLRSGPGTDFRITWEVNRYMPLVLLEKKGEWLKVKDVDGDTHWVFENLVDAKLKCLTIKTAKANIRKKPASSAKKWFTVEKYTSFLWVGGKGKWVKIQYEGEVMWVFHTLVWPAKS